MQTGIVLAGLLREGLKGRSVAARESRRHLMWRDAPLGCRAFWRVVYAMENGGWLIFVQGRRTALNWGDGLSVDGIPGMLTASPKLIAAAAALGITSETLEGDWALLDAAAETAPQRIVWRDLVHLGPWVKGRPQRRLTPTQTVDRETAMEALRPAVAALNAACAGARIEGCPRPVFHRVFNYDLRLGGRLYALGGDSYQSRPKTQRRRIRIDGEPITEVDVRACQLSIFLALSGQPVAHDPYALLGPKALPRSAVKAWFRQTIGGGKPATRWSKGMSSAERCSLTPGPIRHAAEAAYPVLRDMLAVVPPEIIASLPDDSSRPKVIGRYLEFVESEVIGRAVRSLLASGIVVLPMHDGLIVPASAAAVAREAIREASAAILGHALTVI